MRQRDDDPKRFHYTPITRVLGEEFCLRWPTRHSVSSPVGETIALWSNKRANLSNLTPSQAHSLPIPLLSATPQQWERWIQSGGYFAFTGG